MSRHPDSDTGSDEYPALPGLRRDIPESARRLLLSGAKEFARTGFVAATTRMICARAGLSSAALYVYFESKEQLYFELTKLGHQAAYAAASSGSEFGDDPVEELRTVAYAFTLFHAEYHTLACLINYELRSLTPGHLREICGIRRQIDARFREIIGRGVAADVFDCPDIAGAALAFESLGIDVARWFREGRMRTPDSVARMYAQFALNLVRANESGKAGAMISANASHGSLGAAPSGRISQNADH